jgi:deoxyribonuclease-4
VGAHVPVAGGLVKQGIRYAERVGAEVLQVFTSNPRGWAPSAGDPREDSAFRDGCAERGWPVFVHAPYLINLGSPTPATLTRSVAALAHTLARAGAIGARGVVVHGGSAVAGGTKERALDQLRAHLLPLLDLLPDDGPDLLVEPTAGGGQPLCATVEDLEGYFDALDSHPRLGVCLDTCHAFAAGVDLRVEGGVERTLRKVTRIAGRGRLRLVHANDSKDPLGSYRDRHENLGAGTLGRSVFAALITSPQMRSVPLVIETPGGEERHAGDVHLLKRLRSAGGKVRAQPPEGGRLRPR